MISTPILLRRKWFQRGEVTCSKSPSRKWQNWRVLFTCPALECGSAQRPQAVGRAFWSSSAPTSQPLERPLSCKVSRVWLQGVSRACSGLVSGLVSWQKARHLVTRCSVLAEPWVSRLITPCNTALAPEPQLQRPPVPPSQGAGPDQGRAVCLPAPRPHQNQACPEAFCFPIS